MKLGGPQVVWRPHVSTCLVIQKQPQACFVEAFRKELRYSSHAFRQDMSCCHERTCATQLGLCSARHAASVEDCHLCMIGDTNHARQATSSCSLCSPSSPARCGVLSDRI